MDRKVEENYFSRKRFLRRDISSGTARIILYTDDELITEWVRIKEKLGKPPTYKDLRMLRTREELICATQTFSNRFGDGSFVSARENLERIVAEREAMQSQDVHVPKSGIQVFPPVEKGA